VNLRDAMKVYTLDFAAAGGQATVADSRSADEWIKKWLDEKNKRENDLRVKLHALLDHPPQLDEYLRPEMKAAFRADKPPIYEQKPGRVASGGRWAVVSQEGEIISTWKTEDEAKRAAKPYWRGILPSATGPTGTAQVKYIQAADIFVDPELQDRTRSKQKVLQHPKPKVVKDADQLRMGDRRPSSHGQGSAGTGGAGAGGAGGGVGI